MIDLDGTLMHTAPEIARASNRMLAALGKSTLDARQIESYIGEGAHALIQRCLTEQLGAEPEAAEYAEAQKLFFEFYAHNVTESKPYPQVLEGLQALQAAGYPLACVTNKPASFTLPLLEANHLMSYFKLVVSGDTLSKKKPDPDQLFYICEKLGISITDALLIGDSKMDIAAARNAGCYVFTVPYGYNQGQRAKASEVDARIKHIGDALACLH
ncbi:MAG: phosphoglycolate phosphatase [Methylotenera sp.]|nr:phosphoglycolate phosphatase [Methylotenera sp.]MSQ00061.1 phosphoglycolate phosphatase [Methylotenera sp.]